MKKFLLCTAIITGVASASCASQQPQASTKTLTKLTSPKPVILESKGDTTKPTEQVWECLKCTDNEKKTLAFLQKRGIKDRNALATVMGNIKQESNFYTNICEGGARVPYEQCYSGGFGLIQWTTYARYAGLGYFTDRFKLDPNSIEGQLRWMVNEPQWVRYEPYLKNKGQSISYYMDHAWSWLGWGIHGARTHFAHQYHNKLSLRN